MCQASAPMRSIVVAVERKYTSAVFAGIVPDKRHLGTGGYHVCLVHLWSHGKANDYSNRRTLDEATSFTTAGRGFSAAFDISLSKADMKRVHANVRKVFLDRGDPRRKFINAINCWDGTGDAVRYDFQANTAGWASPDHKSHTHGDQPRAYVDVHRDEKMTLKGARAYASVMIGEAKATWTLREEPRTAVKPPTKPTGKPAPPVAKPKPITCRVASGDSLWKIGQRYGVSVGQLKTWNALKSETIQPGQILRLATPPKVTTHTVVKGDTLWAIGKRYHVSPAHLKTWNGLKSDNIFPGKVLRIA